MKLSKNMKKGFLSKTFLYNTIIYQILMLFKFLNISYILLFGETLCKLNTHLCTLIMIFNVSKMNMGGEGEGGGGCFNMATYFLFLNSN